VSSLQANVEPASVAEKVNCGAVPRVRPLGPVSIVVSGAIESTFQLHVAGVASRFPAASVAATSRVWPP
jgi:hypothetical protein